MFLAFVTLLTSLVISSVAIYYSVSGLAAIFAAAAIPIIIMGASLEVGKLVTALWLHRNWKTAPLVLKTYLMIATVVLMLITSIGIFGFLSRAHIEQTAGIGTVSTQIEKINLDIQLEQDKINNNRQIIAQLDTAVNNLLQGSATQSTQTRANSAQQASNLATQATRLRQQQNAERTRLQNEITAASGKVAELNRQKLQLEQQIRNIETEVGPIKYIAQFVYGSEADGNKDLLEKAVTWLILIIIFVFDPLAVLLLIASQISWMEATARWREKRNKKLAANTQEILKEEPVVVQRVEPTIAAEPKKEDINPEVTVVSENKIINAKETPLVDEPKVAAFPTPVNSQITDSVTQTKPVVKVETKNTLDDIKIEVTQEPTVKKKESYMMKQGSQQIVKPKKTS